MECGAEDSRCVFGTRSRNIITFLYVFACRIEDDLCTSLVSKIKGSYNKDFAVFKREFISTVISMKYYGALKSFFGIICSFSPIRIILDFD